MAFQKFSADRTFVKHSESKIDDVLAEGTFIHAGVSTMYEGKREFEVRDASGKTIVVPNSGSLASLMDKYAKIGDYIRITLVKLVPLTSGPGKGKNYRIFEIDIDEDRFAQVGKVEVAATAPTKEETVEPNLDTEL